MNETQLLQAIRFELGKRDDILLLRNNNGAFIDKRGRMVRYGLGKGSSDLVGFIRRKGVAIVLAIEGKVPGGVRSPEQINFIRVIQEAGGIAGFAESVEDALRIVGPKDL